MLTNNRFTRTLLLALLLLGPVALAAAQTTVIDFEDVALPGPESFVAGFNSGGIEFEGALLDGGDFFDSTFGFFASNVTVNQDLAISPGTLTDEDEFILNQLSAAVPPNGADSNFAVLSLFDLSFSLSLIHI